MIICTNIYSKNIKSNKKAKRKFKNKKILLLGLSYKSDCSDIRNSQLISFRKHQQNDFDLTIVDLELIKKDYLMKSL